MKYLLKKDIQSIKDIINNIPITESNGQVEEILISLLEPYFIEPIEKYKIGIARDNRIFFNIGECGKKTHEYALQLLNFPAIDGYLCSGTIKLFNEFVSHIWIELEENLIFEGLFQKFFSKKDYYELFEVKENETFKTHLSNENEIRNIIEFTRLQWKSSHVEKKNKIYDMSMDKDLLDHLRKLKEKGLNKVKIYSNHVEAFDQQLVDIYKIKNPPKKLYHCTSIESAQQIIKDGYLKACTNENDIKYNKVFFSNNHLYIKRSLLGFTVYGESLCNSHSEYLKQECLFRKKWEEYISFEINSNKYDVYNFIDNDEYIILGDVDISNAKTYLVKSNYSKIEISKEDLLKYEYKPILETDIAKIDDLDKFKHSAWIEARRALIKELKTDNSIELNILNSYDSMLEYVKYIGENTYVIDETIEIIKPGQNKTREDYTVRLELIGIPLNYICNIKSIENNKSFNFPA